MSFREQMHQYLEQAEREMAENERALGEFRKIEPQLAELVGEGHGADGWIRVTWTQRGIQDIEFDPRALRQPSDIVSREVKVAINEAMEDLRARTMELVEGLGVPTPQLPDPEEAQAQLARFREEMTSAFRISGVELDRAAALREQYDASRANPRRRGQG